MKTPSFFLPEVSELPLDDVLAHFAEHGYARLGRVMTDEGIVALQQRANALMLGEIAYPGLFFQHDSASGQYEDLSYGQGWQGPSLAYRKLEKLELDPLFLSYLSGKLFERIALSQIDTDVSLYRATLFHKSAEGGSNLPWHQDGGNFWGIDRNPTLQIWTALDDAPIGGGCVEVIAGSHLKGLCSPQGGVVQPDKLARVDAEALALPLPAKAGESMLIHNHLWHRSGRSSSGQQRRALTVCYMSSETRCMRKRREPRQWVKVFSR